MYTYIRRRKCALAAAYYVVVNSFSEGGVLVSCIVRNFLNKDGRVHSVLSREVEVLS